MLVRLAQVLLVAYCAAAAAGEREDKTFAERVEALRGYWLAPSNDPTRARVLHITNVLFAEPRVVVLAGKFGTASAPVWPEAREITARPQGRGIVLEIVPSIESPIAVVTTAQDELRGAAARAGGEAPGLRFSRVSLTEIHRFAADHPLPPLRARSGSTIELVYIGADDCSMCRAWEAGYLGQGRLESSAEWKHLRFTMVKLETLNAAFRVDHVPPRLRPVFSAMLDEGIRIHGVPSFVLLVGDNLRVHALGPAAFDSLVHAALRAAVREKLSAPAAGASSTPRAR